MKRWMTLLLGCLLLCTACGKKELLESIDYAHIHNRKVYLTVNTLLKDCLLYTSDAADEL